MMKPDVFMTNLSAFAPNLCTFVTIVVPENPIEIEFIEFIGVGFLDHV